MYSVTRFFVSDIFHEIVFPQAPENNTRVLSNFFQKFAEIFASQGAPQVSTTLVATLPPVSVSLAANFATSSAGVVNTVGKSVTGVKDTCSKFATGVKNARGNLPPVSTTPRQICHRWQTIGTISDC